MDILTTKISSIICVFRARARERANEIYEIMWREKKPKCLNTIELLTFSQWTEGASERAIEAGKHVTKVNDLRGFETDEKKIFLLMVINCNDFFYTYTFIFEAVINLMRLQSVFSMVPMMLLPLPQKFSLKSHSWVAFNFCSTPRFFHVCGYVQWWFGHKMKKWTWFSAIRRENFQIAFESSTESICPIRLAHQWCASVVLFAVHRCNICSFIWTETLWLETNRKVMCDIIFHSIDQFIW